MSVDYVSVWSLDDDYSDQPEIASLRCHHDGCIKSPTHYTYKTRESRNVFSRCLARPLSSSTPITATW